MAKVSDEPKDVAQKAVLAVAALGVRQIFVHGLNLTGNIALARLLSPTDFGVYAVVIFLITFLGVFGGTGLASNLIRSPEPPSDGEYASVFAAQQSILIAVTLTLISVSPKITRLYHLPAHYVWLFWLAALSLFITSFMVIPQIKLERELAFPKLAIVEIWQTATFNGCAIFMAWKHWGSMAFAIALLARSLTGVIVLFVIEPWLPHWHWDWKLIRSNLAFGFYYQFSQITSLVKDAITPVLIGLLLGAASVGYVSWAIMVASYPVLALMVLQRVYLPVFSRLQAQPLVLTRFVEKVILATNCITAPLSIFLLALIAPISNLIYGSKWDAAIPLFFLFWTTNLVTPTATPLLALLNSMGSSRIVFAFTVLWMVLTWAIGMPLVLWLGAIGLAYATVCVNCSNLVLFAIVKNRLPLSIFPSVAPGWILASAIGFVLRGVNRNYPIRSLPVLFAWLGVGVLLYSAGILYWHGSEFRSLLPERYNRALTP